MFQAHLILFPNIKKESMAKDPAFLFYPGDWLSGTMGMSYEEKGAYLELLIFQFNNGKFTKLQAKQVLSICSTSVFENVVQKFSTDGTYFWKQRLSDEVDRRKKFSDSRRNNALGGKKANKKKKKTGEAYAKHMETEAITETKTKAETETEIIYPFNSEKFSAIWKEWKLYKKSEHRFRFKSEKTEQRALKELSLIAGDEQTAIRIIERSIANGWKGLFKLDKNGKQTNDDAKAAQRIADYLNG